MLALNVSGDGPHNVEDAVQETLWALAKIGQRRQVSLRNDHDVNGPLRLRVPEREHVIRFSDDLNWRMPDKAWSQ